MFEHAMILALSCPDRPGIVSAVSTALLETGCNILDAQQFGDLETGRFFMRVVFDRQSSETDATEIRCRIEHLARAFKMEFTRQGRDIERRVLARAVRDQL